MAKQPWQQTKKKSENDLKKERERKAKRKQEDMENEAIQSRASRYKRVAFMTFVLGFGSFLLKGTSADVSTGGVLTVLSAVGVLLSGVFFIAYGRLAKTDSKFYQILGGAVLGLGIVATAVTFFV